MEINSLFLLLPLTVFVFSLFIPRANRSRGITLLMTGVLLFLSPFLDWNTQIVLLKNWIYNYPLAFDFSTVNLSLFLLTLGITLVSSVFTFGYLKPNTTYYWRVLWFFLIGMQFLLLGGNFLVKFIGWEFLGIASYLLILYFRTNEAIQNATISLWINRLGDLAFLLALIFFSNENYELLGFAIVLAAMTKSAQFPFHAWLNKAMSAPTTVSALLHSATVVASGIYILYYTHTLKIPLPLDWILIVGTITILFSGTNALFRKNAKSLLADSTASQLGFMFVALATQNPQWAIYYLVAHAFFKAGLFLTLIFHYQASGNYIFQNKTLNRPEFVFLLAFSLALIGMPGSASATLKIALLNSFYTTDTLYLLLFGIFLTSAYTSKFILKFFPPHSACPTKKEAVKYFSLLVFTVLSTTLLLRIFRFSFITKNTFLFYYELVAIFLGALTGFFLARHSLTGHTLAQVWENIFKIFYRIGKNISKIERLAEKYIENLLASKMLSLAFIIKKTDDKLDNKHKNIGSFLAKSGKILTLPSYKNLRFYITASLIIFAILLLALLIWN